MTELLPCPFCGDRLVQRHAGWFDHPKGKCILSGRAFHKGWIGQWNKRADLPRPQDAARIAELEAENARLRAALALLEVRAKSLVFAHHHGNGLEGWHTSVDGVDRALTVARAALGADEGKVNDARAEAADEIEDLRAACVEWAEVSQRNYQRAKAAEAENARLLSEMKGGSFYQEKDIDRMQDRIAELEAALIEVTHPDFIWGALDNVYDAETTLDEYAKAVSRAQRAALAADSGAADA